MYVLFWDIDGTLLTTGRAGIFAWEDACLKVLGSTMDLNNLHTTGLTDVEIAAKIVALKGVPPEVPVIKELLRFYEAALPSCLPLRVGSVLPGVREVLDYLSNHKDVISLLLTGNTEAGAKAKLTYYGLAGYFDHGAFAEIGYDRPGIARKALVIAKDILKEDFALEDTYVIGDTPHDIHCGKAIGARAIAVASSVYSVADLLEHEPWWAIDLIPDPQTFINKIRSKN
jgi:phosphoglycolate phosphatase-like HAD superfamily hydrolase